MVPAAIDPNAPSSWISRVTLRPYAAVVASSVAVNRKPPSPQRLSLLALRMRRADAAIEAVVDAAARFAARPSGPRESILIDAPMFSALPAEVALRLLGRAITRVGDEGPVELGKLEAFMAALAANREGRFRRTRAGAMVTLARAMGLVRWKALTVLSNGASESSPAPPRPDRSNEVATEPGA